jgi:hypothetical protein
VLCALLLIAHWRLREVIAETGISDASSLFQNISALSLGKLALSPHVYPSTVTGDVNASG